MNSSPVCILGMHRSNTSMAAQLLSKSGLYLGPPNQMLPPSDKDNPEGYWEDRRFMQVNDILMGMMGGNWHSPPKLPPGWSKHPALGQVRDMATKLVESNKGHEPWGWKDPRSLITFEFWQDFLPDLRCVVILRHPVEVAWSLVNRREHGLPFDEAIAFWDRHMETMFGAAKPRRYIVSHSMSYFYDAEAELKRVLDFLEIEATPELPDLVAKHVRKDLKRSNPVGLAETERSLPVPVMQKYTSLCAEAGPVYDRMMLDADFKQAGEIDSLEKALARIKVLEQFLMDKAECQRRRGLEFEELVRHLQALQRKVGGPGAR